MIPVLSTRQLAGTAAQRARLLFGSTGESIGGAAAIEFAVSASLLLVMAVGVVDVGLGFYRKMQVQNASQAGAYYAMRYGFVTNGISNAVLNGSNNSKITAEPPPRQYCGCPSDTGISEVTCTMKCSDGSAAAKYVTVSAQTTYRTIMVYPVIADTFTMTAISTVRLP